MLGSLLRAMVLLVVLVGVGGYLLGWWDTTGVRSDIREAVGTTGIDTARAREVGAKVGERTAVAAGQAKEALSAGSITAKIKAKMALDDTVKALAVDVDTTGTTVTVSGVVGSSAQRERVLQLARETDGVTQVVDRLTVR